MSRGICSFDGCERENQCKGYCRSHRQQQRRGRPLTAIAPPASSVPVDARFWARVDKSGACWIWTGYVKASDGYGRIGRNYGKVLTHRLSWEMANGPIPDGLYIDHLCHNRRCVNPGHLRLVTPKQNSENMSGANYDSRTGVRNVTWDKVNRKYRVLVGHNGRNIHVGRFDTLEEATAAAAAKRLELYTHSDMAKRAARRAAA